MTDPAHWLDDGLTGPPTLEDDLWFTSHMDDPIKRDPKPMEGQMTLADERCSGYAFWEGFSVRCGLSEGHRGDHHGVKELSGWPGPEQPHRTLMDALEDERRIGQLLERDEREQRRADEDEAQQWRDHPVGKD